MKQQFYADHLPKLKVIAEKSIDDETVIARQPKLQSSSFLPPLARSSISGSTAETGTAVSSRPNAESPPPASMITSVTAREEADRFIQRNHHPSFSIVRGRATSVAATATSVTSAPTRPKLGGLYSHVKSKIDTGRPVRSDTMARRDVDTYQLGPTRPVNWGLLKQTLEQDPQIRAQVKRLQYNPKMNYTAQITTLTNHVRMKVKNYIALTMGSNNERYKIVAQLTVFPSGVPGLHVASRCLWNISTDNSITLKMQGVDCDVLIVVFLCYTDLGDVKNHSDVHM